MKKSTVENAVKVILVVFIGMNALNFLAVRSTWSAVPVVFQGLLLASIWINHKTKIPLLAIWSAILFINGLSAALAIVLGGLQVLLGHPEKMDFDIVRTVRGAVAFSLAAVVYKVLLKDEIEKFRKARVEAGA